MSSEYVCKHCGSDDIVAEVEIRASHEISGRIRERDGKPYFDEDWGPDFEDDFDIVEYVCECGQSHCKLEGLVVRRQAFDQLKRPCGRCDHGATAHELLGGSRKEFLRPPMPCTVEGCDCHDYYDQAVATTPVPDAQLELAA